MSISGSLEDVSVADVMQFIHLGRRTGTLMLARSDEEAMIGFHDGRLVSARGPSTPMLGDLLVNAGVVGQEVLDRVIEEQSQAEEPRSLGQILVADGMIEEESLQQVVSQQIERTISELVSWDQGSFEFAVDELRRIDEISLYPGDIVPEADINTQMVLLEAARIFDERNRSEAEGDDESITDPLDDTHPVVGEDSLVEPPADLEPAAPVEPLADELRELESAWAAGELDRVLQVVSADGGFIAALSADAPLEAGSVQAVSLSDAEDYTGDPSSSIVLVDLRNGQATLEDIAELHRRRATSPIIALVDRVVPVSQVYSAGALAALPAEVEAVVACVLNVLQSQRQLAKVVGRSSMPAPNRAGVAKLRRVFGDLRSGLMSATVALNLMHIISESVERAVLFLVRRDCLQALGAFGMGLNGRPLAELTRGLRLDLEDTNVLTDSLNTGEAINLQFAEAVIPEVLSSVLSPPLTGQVVVFPVLGSQRVISVIYTDNGQIDRPIEDIEILELATAQVGMAFENELLRRQISQQNV